MPVEKPDGRQIVRMACDGRLSCRPEFYSGRRAMRGDLNENHLLAIHKVVKREYDEEAAQHFVQMIADIESLAATAFLNTFYTFVSRGCRWVPTDTPESNVDVGPDNGKSGYDNPRYAIGMATIGMALFGQDDGPGETESIRHSFLFHFRDQYTPNPNHDNGWGCCSYRYERFDDEFSEGDSEDGDGTEKSSRRKPAKKSARTKKGNGRSHSKSGNW